MSNVKVLELAFYFLKERTERKRKRLMILVEVSKIQSTLVAVHETDP